MNKRCYKVIFNKKRSCMMAVAENVHRDGKSMQDSEAASVRVTGAASVSSARAAFGFRMAAFSVMLALGVLLRFPLPLLPASLPTNPPLKTNKPLFFRQQTVCRKSIFKLRHPKAFLLTDSSSSMLMKKA